MRIPKNIESLIKDKCFVLKRKYFSQKENPLLSVTSTVLIKRNNIFDASHLKKKCVLTYFKVISQVFF